MYVESMVLELLGNEWRSVGANWAGWDIEHQDGTRLEVRQSAAKQSWEPSARGYSSPSFSIRQPTIAYSGAKAEKIDFRQADIYLFGWHGVMSEIADHRDVDQWEFFVTLATALPNQKTLGLAALKRIAEPTTAAQLAEITDGLRSRRKCQ
jgi:hypothetical protein